MNCTQAHELLPLYAGRDLDEKRARLVSEHIQICTACTRVAGEYREAVELAQHFAPPVFSEDVYANVRRQVMQQIENEPAEPLLPQLFGSWIRPQRPRYGQQPPRARGLKGSLRKTNAGASAAL